MSDFVVAGIWLAVGIIAIGAVLYFLGLDDE